MIWHLFLNLGSGITKNSEIKPLLQVSYRLLQNLVSFAKLKTNLSPFGVLVSLVQPIPCNKIYFTLG